MGHGMKYLLLSLAIVAAVLTTAGRATAQPGVVTQTGTLPDGATHIIEVPANWNGTLLLYSHGYVVPGSANLAVDAGDPGIRKIRAYAVPAPV